MTDFEGLPVIYTENESYLFIKVSQELLTEFFYLLEYISFFRFRWK